MPYAIRMHFLHPVCAKFAVVCFIAGYRMVKTGARILRSSTTNEREEVDTQSNNRSVDGELGYLRPMQELPFQTMYEPPHGVAATNCIFDMHRCHIYDARQVGSPGSLDDAGFTLLNEPSRVTDFYDEQQVIGLYYSEIEALALELYGGVKAKVFDHLLRQREERHVPLTMGRPGDGSKPAAVGRVHNDYTDASGKARLSMVFPNHAQSVPFVILNFWRPVIDPVVDTPLALCDCRSFSMSDWADCDIVYPNRTGKIYLGQYAAAHRWYYYPKMRPTELLVFKTYDSRTDVPGRMTPHCAFDDPTADPNAPRRRSMEIRCLVVLE